MRKRRFGGNSSPDGWEPPRGGARARGAHGKPLSSRRATGAYRVRPWVGQGAASSEQAKSKQEGKWVGAPSGGRTGKGCARQAPIVPKGDRGLPGAPLGGAGGGKQRASNEQARRQMVGSPLGGARARGAHGKPLSSRRATGAYRVRPWVGRGKIAAGKAIVPPNYGGERG